MAENEKTTSDQLRQEIDRGRASDKVPFSDPSAAPLGTDDEAAGTPPTEAQIRHAREAETLSHPQKGPERAENNRTISDRQGHMMSGSAVWIIAAVAVIAILIFVML